MYSDKNLTCADCGQEFVFTASEQDFYAQRGFTEPRRCPSCRASRKAARNAEGGGSSYGGYGAGGGIPPAVRATAVAVAAMPPAIVARARCSRPPARAAVARPRSRSARPAASPSTAATASGASAEADPVLSVRAGPSARRTSTRPTTPVVSRPGSVDSTAVTSAARQGDRSVRCSFRRSLTHAGALAPLLARPLRLGSVLTACPQPSGQLPLGALAGEQPEVELALTPVDQPIDVVGVGQPDQGGTDRRVDDVGQGSRRHHEQDQQHRREHRRRAHE